MTFAVSAALGQETIGVRMEFLAKSDAIRADALKRLEGGANPIAVVQTLTDGTRFIDVFGEGINSFAGKLNAVLGGGDRGGRGGGELPGGGRRAGTRAAGYTA